MLITAVPERPLGLRYVFTLHNPEGKRPIRFDSAWRRAGPNLLRTLNKLEAFGLLEMQTIGRRRVPAAKIAMLRLDIDPYAMADKIAASPAL